jgi:hypothetical protein
MPWSVGCPDKPCLGKVRVCVYMRERERKRERER